MPVHKVALFGMGRAGLIHFRNILKSHQMVLAYVVEADHSRAKSLMDEYNQTNITLVLPEEADKVYKDQSVEAVIVATPTFTHEEIVIKALQHGKSVFCEKPIGQSPAATKACYEAAEKAGKTLLCSFNRRFDPSLRIAMQKAKSQEAGKIHMVKSTARDNPVPPEHYIKISGGIFHDCAVHDIDLICWVLGEYPIRVFTQATSHIPFIAALDDVDCAAIILTFPSNVIAIIDIDRDAKYGYDQRLEIFGDKGMVISENQRSSGVEVLDQKGTHTDVLYHSFPERYADSYVNALQHFIDVLEGKVECEVTKRNTLLVSRVADACEESTRTKLPVDIDHNI